MDNSGADARRLGLPSTATTHATTTATLRNIFDTHLTFTKQWVAKSLGLGETSQATASGLGLGESFILDMGACLLTCSCVLVVVCVVVCLLGVVGGGFVVVVWLSSSFRSCTRTLSGAELRRPLMSSYDIG